MNRYARQMLLPEVGTCGQRRLAAARVAVVGAGGLGAPVLQYLAGAGVGHITLIDPDCVEESNLHRQPLFTMADLGRPKVQAARERLCALAPALRLEVRQTALDPANAAAVVADAEVVVDAADSFAVSYTLSDECLRQSRPLISASALGLTGYAGGFCGGAPSLRAVFPDPPATAQTCAGAGVLGPVVGTIGAIQAQMVLQQLLGFDPSPLGRMVTADLRSYRFGGFGFEEAPEPECGFPFVALSDLRPEDRVVDLRGANEAPHPATAAASRLSPEKAARLRPDPARRLVLCCATGLRAWRVAAALRRDGHDEAKIALVAVGNGG